MTTWQITSRDGEDLGLYTAVTREDAFDLLHADAGYRSTLDCARQIGSARVGESDEECVARLIAECSWTVVS